MPDKVGGDKMKALMENAAKHASIRREAREARAIRRRAPVEYHVWAHVEGVDDGGDMLEGDSHFEPVKIASFGTREEAEDCAGSLDAAAAARIRDLEQALQAARGVLETAKRYFPKSIRNSDTYSLRNVLANSVNEALEPKKEN